MMLGEVSFLDMVTSWILDVGPKCGLHTVVSVFSEKFSAGDPTTHSFDHSDHDPLNDVQNTSRI